MCFFNEREIKDTHREIVHSKGKSMNTDIWVIGASNQIFTTGS